MSSNDSTRNPRPTSPNVFQQLAALRDERVRQDRELARLKEVLLERGEPVLVNEADLTALEELTAPMSLHLALPSGPSPWTSARC